MRYKTPNSASLKKADHADMAMEIIRHFFDGLTSAEARYVLRECDRLIDSSRLHIEPDEKCVLYYGKVLRNPPPPPPKC
ncbi:hypothetical protein LJH26_004288 [Salmonella enterica]|nr:hypothetical protein [Salmonella enterica]